MDTLLGWWRPRKDNPAADTQSAGGSRAAFGGDEEPVLVATIDGPVQIEMAKDALAMADIPALVKQNSLGPVYGLSVGSFGAAEVWVLPVLAEQARETLMGIGLLELSDEDMTDEADEQHGE